MKDRRSQLKLNVVFLQFSVLFFLPHHILVAKSNELQTFMFPLLIRLRDPPPSSLQFLSFNLKFPFSNPTQRGPLSLSFLCQFHSWPRAECGLHDSWTPKGHNRKKSPRRPSMRWSNISQLFSSSAKTAKISCLRDTWCRCAFPFIMKVSWRLKVKKYRLHF